MKNIHSVVILEWRYGDIPNLNSFVCNFILTKTGCFSKSPFTRTMFAAIFSSKKCERVESVVNFLGLDYLITTSNNNIGIHKYSWFITFQSSVYLQYRFTHHLIQKTLKTFHNFAWQISVNYT